MLKTFCIAFIFVAAGGMMAARARTDSATAAGPSVEQNAPQAVPCPRRDCPPQTHRSISQRRRPWSAAGTLIRGFTLSASPPPWQLQTHLLAQAGAFPMTISAQSEPPLPCAPPHAVEVRCRLDVEILRKKGF
jgi:hypothetical protein